VGSQSQVTEVGWALVLFRFSEGPAAVRPGNISAGYDGKVGYLNTNGEWSVKPQFDEGHDFSEGLAAVNQGAKGRMGGKWGYIDKNGMLAIPLLYQFADQFKSGQACVLEAEQWKLIDRSGNGTPVEKNKCLAK
jgi:WG containing repeat